MNPFYRMHWSEMLKVTYFPLIFLTIIYISSYSIQYLPENFFLTEELKYDISFYFLKLMPLIGIYWLCHNFLTLCITKLHTWATENKYPLLLIMIPPVRSSLHGILLLVTFNMGILSLQLGGVLGLFLKKLAKVLIILILSHVIYKLVSSIEQYLTNKYITNTTDISTSRKVQTQIIILRRVVAFIIFVITLSAIIMVFDSLRNIGASFLTTAGIISAIGAFASQQSLARLFAGLQLAFTQPVRMGDTVIIDNEFGQIEEITLAFVTIKLWDLRRLILPTDYFTQKGVLNLTKESSELLGTVLLYADYTLPVNQVREQFLKLVKASPLWNQKVAELDVTDFKEHSIEIRCLVSADNAGNLWKLRCNIRESLIQYIINNHHDCFTKMRNVTIAT